MGSEKSPLNSSDSSCAKAFLAITNKKIVSMNARDISLYNIYRRKFWNHHTFECLLDVDSLFGAGLKVWDSAFRLAKCHGSLRGYHSFVLFYINLISKDNLCLVRQQLVGLLEAGLQRGNFPDLGGWPGLETHPANCPGYRNSLSC